jgi:glycerate 2-kinase
MSEASRQLARAIFHEAMAATTVEAACHRALHMDGNTLHANDLAIDLTAITAIQIISIGKAGATLFDAVRKILPQNISTHAVISAPFPPQHLTANDSFFPGGHPLPNAASLEAAQAALDLLSTANATTLVLFLISGGASAMFEQPIDASITLDELIELNRQLVASGAAIQQINTVRKHLSAVKGGHLAAAAPSATKLSLLISDVPSNALDALASGPTLPDTTTVEQTLSIVAEFLPSPPRSIRALLPGLIETPKPDHPTFANAHHTILLDNAELLAAAQQAAEHRGFHVTIDNSCDDWPYERAAAYLLDRSAALTLQHKKSCLLSGGEVTVQLPAVSGAGGRNQQLALFAAQHLPTDTTLLSVGSDGIDGNSPAAGAVVDGTTWQRAQQVGLDPAQALARFDTFSVLSAQNDAIVTGPSGNNLRDIRILLTGAS